MEFENQMLVDATEATQCTAADDSTRPPSCQAHENYHYRELAGRVIRATILEDSALAVLRKDQLTIQDRDTLEQAVRTARTLKKITPPEVEL
jgi:hypothetical protein